MTQPADTEEGFCAIRLAFGVPAYVMGDQPRPTELQALTALAERAGYLPHNADSAP